MKVNPYPLVRSVHIIGSKQSGGAERFYARLLLSLCQSGSPVLGINPPNSMVAAELGNRVDQKFVAMRGVWDLLSSWQIRRQVKQFDADIVQSYMGRATRLTRLPPGSKAIHVARLGGYYNLQGYRHADAWVGNTRGICSYLVDNGFPAERVYHIGNFVTPALSPSDELLQELRATLNLPANAFVITAVGRLHPNKGFADLLDAFVQIIGKSKERLPYLVVVGDGPLREDLYEHAKRLGIQSNLRWVGWQTELSTYYTIADLCICPSRHEPLGNVILEIWSYRKPLITTATDGARELVTDGKNAVMVPVNDADRLAEAMERLMNADDDERYRMGSQGYHTVRNEHSVERVTGEYLAMYRKLIKGKK